MNNKLNLQELLSFAGKYKYFTYASWVLSGISSLIAIIPFWFVWKIALCVIFSEDTADIPRYGKLAALFAVIAILVYVAALMCSHKAAFRTASNIRIRLVNHISSLPLGAIESFGTGSLRRIITDTSGAAETYLAHQLPDKYGAIASALGLTGLLMWQDWRIALVSLAPIVLGFVVMSFMTGESMRAKIAEYQNALNLMSNEAVEYIRGMPVIKTFGQSIYSFQRFQKAITNYEDWTIAYTNELRLPMMLFTLAVNGSFIFLILAGVFVALKWGVSDDFMMSFVLAVIVSPLISVTLMRTIRQNENEMLSADALRRINEVLALKSLSVSSHTTAPEDSDIEFHNISFSYGKGRRTEALSAVNLAVKSGQTLALVGRSGGGKSTAAKLAARFFDADKGTITIGGVNVKNIPLDDLMSRIAIVFQDSRVIKGSLLDNVRMSRPSASREEVIKAMEQAQCSDILAKYTLDTVIGSEGVYLSGGETQRLCVARALLKDSPIVILDEATAYTDPDNEARMQIALSELSRNKTVIMIAHRLSAVKDADIIAVLDEGKITESGSFDELIERKGTFYAMWNEYQSSLSWNINREGR